MDIITNHQLTKLLEKFFLSRIFLSHLHKLLLLILTPRPFLFSNFLIPILFRLPRNTSSCQLSAYSYHRETWSFSQFLKKNQFFKKLESSQYFLWFLCEKWDFTVFALNTYITDELEQRRNENSKRSWGKNHISSKTFPRNVKHI